MDPDLRDRWLEHAHATVRRAGLRTGAARAAVLELLATDGQCLVSPLELTDRIRSRSVGSAASVYRVLDELHDLGLLRRSAAQDGTVRYEVADPAGQHHHFVDLDSGEIRAFSDDRLEAAVADAARRLGVELAGHEIVLRGRSEST